MSPATLRAAWAVIGGLLVDGDATLGVSLLLPVESMPTPETREAYRVMVGMAERGEHVDFVTVCCELERVGKLGLVGEANLMESINEAPSSIYVEAYAKQVAEAAKRSKPTDVPQGVIAL